MSYGCCYGQIYVLLWLLCRMDVAMGRYNYVLLWLLCRMDVAMGRYMCCYDYYVVWMLLWADIIMCCYDYYVVWMLLWADICAAMTIMSYGCCYGQIYVLLWLLCRMDVATGRYRCCYDCYVVWMLLWADIGAAMTVMSYGCCYGQIYVPLWLLCRMDVAIQADTHMCCHRSFSCCVVWMLLGAYEQYPLVRCLGGQMSVAQ